MDFYVRVVIRKYLISADIAVTADKDSKINFVTDRNDSTCNPVSNANSIVLTFSLPKPFFWLRLHIRAECKILMFCV